MVVFGVVASFATGAVAHAAPKPFCNLVADPAGDVVIRPPAGAPVPYAASAVDIRSADVVSDAEGLGVTLRVAGMGGTNASSTHTDLGLTQTDFKVFLTIESAGREVILHAMGPGDNAVGQAFYLAGTAWRYDVGHFMNDATYTYADEQFGYLGAARGAVDLAKSEIRMSVSWADLKKYGYPHAKRDRVVKIRAVAQDYWLSSGYGDTILDPGGVRYRGAPYDQATTKAAYPLGARTCTSKVTVGR
jgi:hypothetical protein